jgi:Fe-S-cluster containining protein
MKKIGRNDSCFCGSGEKYKNCCGADIPIHPESIIGKLLIAYKRVDQLLIQNAALNEIVPCREKCSECCYILPFRVTQQEFLLVQVALETLNTKVINEIIETNEPIYRRIVDQCPSTAKTINKQWKNANEYYQDRSLISSVESTMMPEKCPFLRNDLCQVYKFRPYICRIHGKGQISQPTGCSKIDRLDIFHLQVKIPIEFDPDYATRSYSIGLPLFTWVHRRKNDISITPLERQTFFTQPFNMNEMDHS